METKTYSEAFIDKHRYINVEHDWWEFIYEDFVQKMADNGINVTEEKRCGRLRDYTEYAIYFSGFCSQGDGACFDGRVDDWAKLLGDQIDKYPWLKRLVAANDAPAMLWKQSGRYYHENSLDYSFDYLPFGEAEVTHFADEFMAAVAEADDWCSQYNTEMATLEECVKELVRGFCRQLYKDLEEKHDYQTSDEAVIETLQANDIEEDDDES